MANIILPSAWRVAEREATSESVYLTRRACLGLLGLGGLALTGILPGCSVPVREECVPSQKGGLFVCLHPQNATRFRSLNSTSSALDGRTHRGPVQ